MLELVSFILDLHGVMPVSHLLQAAAPLAATSSSCRSLSLWRLPRHPAGTRSPHHPAGHRPSGGRHVILQATAPLAVAASSCKAPPPWQPGKLRLSSEAMVLDASYIMIRVVSGTHVNAGYPSPQAEVKRSPQGRDRL
jgi:hypothetical protein